MKFIRKYPVCASIFPEAVQRTLYGDRKCGIDTFDAEDVDWKQWQKHYRQFYSDTQKNGIGAVVNRAGYQVLATYCLANLSCLEIGPGILPHTKFWRGIPRRYDIADIQQEMIDASSARLAELGVKSREYLLSGDRKSFVIPAPDAHYDCIITFYSLEHVNPLRAHLYEYKRLLRPGGVLIGAIPTEGGMAWGVGRALTSRRYVKKKFSFNFDKITAWEHCNTAQDILSACDDIFEQTHCDFWPFKIPLIDCNLVVRFLYRNSL